MVPCYDGYAHDLIVPAGGPPLKSLMSPRGTLDPLGSSGNNGTLAFRVKTAAGGKAKLKGKTIANGGKRVGGAVVEWKDSGEDTKKAKALQLKAEAKKLKQQKKMQVSFELVCSR